jgi:phosphatidylglycerophosphate synthase
MVSTVFILLIKNFPTYYYIIPVAIITAREVAISGLREWMAHKKLREAVKVNIYGKLKTTFLMIATALLLLATPEKSNDVDLCYLFNLPVTSIFFAGMISLYIATITSVLSAGYYCASAFSVIQSETHILEDAKKE